MRLLLVDDELLALQDLEDTVKKVAADSEIFSFQKAEEALSFASKNNIDVAFLDINMRVMDGITMAKKLKVMNPVVNIVFCTGYSEYSIEALNIFCSAYLMKPINAEKVKSALDNLRYPPEKPKNVTKELPFVRCFGSFEIFTNGVPVRFKYSKSKEIIAYLINKNGNDCLTEELMKAIFGSVEKTSYFQNVRRDTLNTLRGAGINSMLREGRGHLGINKKMLNCDYYSYLEGKTAKPSEDYMPQYEFAKETREKLKT